MQQFERDLKKEDNKNIVLSLITELDLEYKFNINDDINYVSNVEIFNKNINSIGSGKGNNHEIGAIAEAIEHLILKENKSITFENKCSEIISINNINKDGIFRNLSFFQNDILSCAKMVDFFNPSKEILFPIVLRNGNNKQKNSAELFLSKYGTNSGVALGTSKQEAILHGAMELLERHYLSKLYEYLILGKLGNTNDFINIGSSLKILKKIGFILPNIISDSDVIVSQSVNGIYFAAAIEKNKSINHPISQIGSGCSINMEYAIYRAITEYNQIIRLYDENEYNDDEKILKFLMGRKKLIPLINIDTSNFPRFNISIKNTEPMSSCKILNNINILLKGKNIFYEELIGFENGSSVCSTYIPGLERFNLIRLGKEVVPQRILCK